MSCKKLVFEGHEQFEIHCELCQISKMSSPVLLYIFYQSWTMRNHCRKQQVISFKHHVCSDKLDVHLSLHFFTSLIRGFFETPEVGIICIRGFTTWKQKFPVAKCYPKGVLNPWASDSKSDTPLSEPTWHFLVTLKLFPPYICWGISYTAITIKAEAILKANSHPH